MGPRETRKEEMKPTFRVGGERVGDGERVKHISELGMIELANGLEWGRGIVRYFNLLVFWPTSPIRMYAS